MLSTLRSCAVHRRRTLPALLSLTGPGWNDHGAPMPAGEASPGAALDVEQPAVLSSATSSAATSPAASSAVSPPPALVWGLLGRYSEAHAASSPCNLRSEDVPGQLLGVPSGDAAGALSAATPLLMRSRTYAHQAASLLLPVSCQALLRQATSDAASGAPIKEGAAGSRRYARRGAPMTPTKTGVAFPDGNLLRDDITPSASASQSELMKPQKEDVASGIIPEVWGRVHSIESFSAVDGPGIRSVVFLQGCLRRCIFCANPDTWNPMSKSLQRISSKSIAARLKRNLSYYEGGGGVTLSGGDPMMQPQFCAAIFKEAHALGITTCLDTAGYGHANDWAAVLPNTDLVMLCTKAMDPKLYFKMVEVKQKIMLDFAKAVADYGVPMVIRFVLVPGMTDTREEVEALVDWAKRQPTLTGIEMLPYHRLGVNKWEELGLKYPLEGMEPPPKETMEFWKAYIQAQGIPVLL